VDNWNCQACAERLVKDHFGKSDQHPAVSLVRSWVVKVVKAMREDRANNSGELNYRLLLAISGHFWPKKFAT
jgi:hypothetical protein